MKYLLKKILATLTSILVLLFFLFPSNGTVFANADSLKNMDQNFQYEINDIQQNQDCENEEGTICSNPSGCSCGIDFNLYLGNETNFEKNFFYQTICFSDFKDLKITPDPPPPKK
jgi:hypothetical protein